MSASASLSASLFSTMALTLSLAPCRQRLEPQAPTQQRQGQVRARTSAGAAERQRQRPGQPGACFALPSCEQGQTQRATTHPPQRHSPQFSDQCECRAQTSSCYAEGPWMYRGQSPLNLRTSLLHPRFRFCRTRRKLWHVLLATSIVLVSKVRQPVLGSSEVLRVELSADEVAAGECTGHGCHA